MSQLQRLSETIATYRKHGWQLRRVLLRPDTRAAAAESLQETPLAGARVEEAEVDALWFARASHGGHEAWELRLVGEVPYALFETFEADEPEAEREEARREMQARLCEYAAGDFNHPHQS